MKSIIKNLNLIPHPEGGFYKQTYRKDIASNIHYLLEAHDFSAFHIIKQDEMWYHIDGSPMLIHMISKDGKYSKAVVGGDYKKHAIPTFLVPANTYFAATPLLNHYSLVACSVFPAFNFEDFYLPPYYELIKLFPQHEKIIKEFTKS